MKLQRRLYREGKKQVFRGAIKGHMDTPTGYVLLGHLHRQYACCPTNGITRMNSWRPTNYISLI